MYIFRGCVQVVSSQVVSRQVVLVVKFNYLKYKDLKEVVTSYGQVTCTIFPTGGKWFVD